MAGGTGLFICGSTGHRRGRGHPTFASISDGTHQQRLDTRASDATLASLLGWLAGARIGFEAAHLTVSRHRWLTATLQDGGASPPELVATEGLVERSRVRKDRYELETLREAARRLSAVATG